MNKVDIEVEKYIQSKKWSCGPAALKILLSYYGTEVSEEELIELSGTNETQGATHDGLISAVKAFGFSPYSSENTDDSVLLRFLGNHEPVLIDFQGNNGGHYVVGTAFSSQRIHIQDPRTSGENHYTLDFNLFKARWYSVEYGTRKFINRWMLAVE